MNIITKRSDFKILCIQNFPTQQVNMLILFIFCLSNNNQTKYLIIKGTKMCDSLINKDLKLNTI